LRRLRLRDAGKSGNRRWRKRQDPHAVANAHLLLPDIVFERGFEPNAAPSQARLVNFARDLRFGLA
jgi:hypothetical protein